MHFHSLDNLASDIVSEMRSGKTAFIQFPRYINRDFWQQEVLVACQNELRLQGEDIGFELVFVEDGRCGPTDVIDNIDLSTDSGVSRFLTEYGYDPIAFLVYKPLSDLPDWVEFFEKITRGQKGVNASHMSRLILVITDSEEIPGHYATASVSTYQYWNPVRWEELRLAAHEWLGQSANEATLAWMVATYVGASNGDPVCLKELCIDKPRTIRDVISVNFKNTILRTRQSAISKADPQSVKNFSWKLPIQFEREWDENGLVGLTLDRGPKHATGLENDSAHTEDLRRAIWKEQSSGLLSLIIEIGYQTNQALDRMLKSEWRVRLAQYCGCSTGESYFREPTDIINFVHNEPDLRLPETFLGLLRELRGVRNKLAHLVPIELTPMKQIWDMYVRTQNT